MWVKICGINDPATIGPIAALRPDAVGFNFYAGSRRSVTVERAAEAIRLLPVGIEPVGLFVNHTLDEIRATCAATGIRTVQLHGDETPEFAAALAELRVIRVYRIGAEGLSRIGDDVRECRRLGLEPSACLVDAAVAGRYGGSGATAPWDVIAGEWNRDEWPPLVLAGGLTPENVGAAVARVRPWGVDVASGVESSAGVKDPSMVVRFIAAARGAS